MKPSTTLHEAFLVFLALTAIAVSNAGQLWERHEISTQYATMELTQRLELDRDQVEKIRIINTAFETALSQVGYENYSARRKKIQLLMNERDKQIMEVLSESQKSVLNAYCTDLVSVANVIE